MNFQIVTKKSASNQELFKDAKRFGIPVVTEALPETSRPSAILSALCHEPDLNALYLEPGARLREAPTGLVNLDADVAVYVHKEFSRIQEPFELWDGIGWLKQDTIWCRNTPDAREFLAKWIEKIEAFPSLSAQTVVSFALKVKAKVASLPRSYSWVERVMRQSDRKATPVIEHLGSDMPGAPARLGDQTKVAPPFVRGFHGLGDAFYMRPAIRRFLRYWDELYLENPWIQFWDGDPRVKMVRPPQSLRTQTASMEGRKGWHTKPDETVNYILQYELYRSNPQMTPIRQFMRGMDDEEEPTRDDYIYDASRHVKPWMQDLRKKGLLGIVKPPTIRKESRDPARNPKPGYINFLTSQTPEIQWISVGWLKEEEEWLDGEMPEVSRSFMRGEISIEDVAGLVAVADIVLTPICFLFGMATAIGTPTFTVFGGSIPPSLLVEPNCVGPLSWAAPDPFCPCRSMTHQCRKDIPLDKLQAEFWKFFEEERKR